MLETSNFRTHFLTLQFEGLLVNISHETPQTVRYMSVVYVHIEGLVSELTFGYRANLVTCNFVHIFPTFGHNLKVFWSILLHETPQTVRYMSVVYAF